MTHSPEPWALVPEELVPFITDRDGDCVLENGICLDEHVRRDMDRIVACVNACAGIPTEDLIGKSVQPRIVVQDVYRDRDGSAIMMATEEVLVFGKEVADVNVIEVKILDPREKPRGSDDCEAYIEDER